MSEQIEQNVPETDLEVTTTDSAALNGSGEVVELPRSVLTRAMWRHIISLQWSWNYERMQGLGYVYSMMPIISAVYKNKEDRVAAIKRHLAFYNTNPYVSPVVFGATAAMEAQKEGEVVDSLKVGLMGPLAGIGDTLTGVLFKPLLSVAAAGIAMTGGSLGFIGPAIMLLGSVLLIATMIPQFWFGYRQGINVAREVSGEGTVNKVTELATIMGLIVIGGFIPSIMSSLKTPLSFTYAASAKQVQTVSIQTGVLDKILPYAIPVALVAFAYWLLKGLKVPVIWTLLILAVIGFVCSLFGIL
ncbi:PTS system mannose/fructose/sorbose family transporter subunit IID [Ktedonosporobacter rubrisoli]|uniref:PTS system mannose/fructose/sorbose family transporter subunit IID n=1 Tax=Ktedonosporobacter rubrisoli TaxID=2509675 RepID=UPI001A9168D5|nr:PTS system mannose/fructose/sorbose family transporter subunit IID [Ktedonosporobacter rubrisoli]